MSRDTELICDESQSKLSVSQFYKKAYIIQRKSSFNTKEKLNYTNSIGDPKSSETQCYTY